MSSLKNIDGTPVRSFRALGICSIDERSSTVVNAANTHLVHSAGTGSPRYR